MKITARRLRPDAKLNSFLGLLDIKLGVYISRKGNEVPIADVSTGAEIILLFGVGLLLFQTSQTS